MPNGSEKIYQGFTFLDHQDQTDIYIYIYLYIFKQVSLKTMEHCSLFLISFFQVSLLLFLCRNLDGKYFLPKSFQRYGTIPLPFRSQHRKKLRRLEKIKLKIVNKQCSIIFNIVSKVGDHSRGYPEGSLFDSYYTKV